MKTTVFDNWQKRDQKLASGMRSAIHARTVLLRDKLADPKFVKQASSKGLDPHEEFNRRSLESGQALSFNGLVKILNHYPNEEQWLQGDLRDLAKKIADSQKAPETEKSKPTASHHVISQAMHRELQQELWEATQRIKALQTLLEEKEKVIQRLEKAIDSLTRKIA